jgi:hypothetical protein
MLAAARTLLRDVRPFAREEDFVSIRVTAMWRSFLLVAGVFVVA